MKLALLSAGVRTCRSLTVEDTDNKCWASNSLLCVPQQSKQSSMSLLCQPGDRNGSSGTDTQFYYNSVSFCRCCKNNIIKPVSYISQWSCVMLLCKLKTNGLGVLLLYSVICSQSSKWQRTSWTWLKYPQVIADHVLSCMLSAFN